MADRPLDPTNRRKSIAGTLKHSSRSQADTDRRRASSQKTEAGNFDEKKKDA
jgi:hypothetical protein